MRVWPTLVSVLYLNHQGIVIVSSRMRSNVSNTRKSVSSVIQNIRKNLAQLSFFNKLQSVWISIETLFQVFDIASQSINILGEIQSKRSPNLKKISITYPNLLHGNDFLCFVFMNY